MGLLVSVLAVCCVGLLLLAGTLWLRVQQGGERSSSPIAPAPAVVRSPVTRPPLWVVHPRMDLASGVIPANQAVDLERRRDRHRENRSRMRRAEPVRFAPFAERRRLPARRRQRLDLVYALDTMGDLSDPDLRTPSATRVGALHVTSRVRLG